MRLLNSNRFYLEGTNKRFLHLGTVIDGLREYLCFYDMIEKKCYIEEILYGQLTFIEDENIVKELADFLFREKVTDIKYGIAAPDKID